MLRVDWNDLEAADEWGAVYIWQGKPFTGLAYERYPNGQLANICEMHDGFEEGALCEWYPSGQPRLEGYEYNYWSGGIKKHAHIAWAREWYENGVVKREGYSENGRMIREQHWNESGEPISRPVRPTQIPQSAPPQQSSRFEGRWQEHHLPHHRFANLIAKVRRFFGI